MSFIMAPKLTRLQKAAAIAAIISASAAVIGVGITNAQAATTLTASADLDRGDHCFDDVKTKDAHARVATCALEFCKLRIPATSFGFAGRSGLSI